jgi:hypothetical protein
MRDELDFWHSLVEKYSKRKLTYAQDLLPAISGIASRMSTLKSGDYLAGMWSLDVVRSLTWNSPDGENCHRIPTTSTPSWSWASRIGQVVWVKHNFLAEHWATCLKAETYGPADASYLSANGGSIKLFSRMISVQVRGFGSNNWTIQLADTSDPGYTPTTSHMYPDSMEDIDKLNDGEILQCLQLAACDDMKPDASRQVALSIAGMEQRGEHLIMGMILRGDLELRQFRRIGLVVDVEPAWFGTSEKVDVTIT